MRLPWEPAAPDNACPECGHLDAVPVRVLERSRVESGRSVTRRVGQVYRCGRCATEYCAGPQGVYVPQPRRAMTADVVTGIATKRDKDIVMRDSDMQWDRARKT